MPMPNNSKKSYPFFSQTLPAGMWWSAVFPGLLLVAMVLLTDRLGENLRVILDPYSAQE